VPNISAAVSSACSITGSWLLCLASGKYNAQIEEDVQEGMRAGVSGTPGFFVNGIPLSGAKSEAAFEKIIQAELAAFESKQATQ